MHHSTCANCDAPLSGPYCSQCGQHVHDSVRTLGALLHDGWHVLTHLDGRFWATTRLLLLRPGRLTVEYFASRRARYVPPVRLYLVLSIALFATVSLTSRHASEPAPASVASPAASPAAGLSGGSDVELLNFGLLTEHCDGLNSSWAWMTQALRASCERNRATGGREIAHAVRANLPRMMFVFLPLMAVVMTLLYWFPRRYYVEHLVFFLHNHAALYLAMIVALLATRLPDAAPALSRLGGWTVAATSLYAAWYVYRSMRTVYGQGRLLTLLKISVVSLAYAIFLTITAVITVLVTALTT